MTGGVCAYLVAAYEHIAGHSVSETVWIGLLGTILFMVGSFLAWNEQFDKAMLAGNPEVYFEYEKRRNQVSPYMLIRNIGGENAYRIKIRDVTNGNSNASFDEVSCLAEDESCPVAFNIKKAEGISPFYARSFEKFLRDKPLENSGSIAEDILSSLTPQNVLLVVDYFNVSDMRFTVEFEIQYSYGWDEAKTRFIRRYFNPVRKKPLG